MFIKLCIIETKKENYWKHYSGDRDLIMNSIVDL